MKQKFSFKALLHNDRLMLLVSLVLGIVVWATVVYGPSNEQERKISGVPVVVTLGEYATDTLNLRIVEGQDLTASVTVYGRRSIVEQLTAQDILLTADTSSVIAPGAYKSLDIQATKNGKQNDYEIRTVEPAAATLTCDIWVEDMVFAVQPQIPNITAADETKYQLGTPAVSGGAVENATVKISGPKAEIESIASIVAVTDKQAALTETAVFDATLKALGKDGNEVDISHCTLNADNAAVKVTVPILVYRKVDLQYTLVNAPTAYADAKNLITFSPAYLELWGAEQTINDFETSLATLCTFDFDRLSKDNLTQTLDLQIPETLKVLGGVETVTAKWNLGNISTKKMTLELTKDNVSVVNCPSDIAVIPTETTLSNIVLCGPANVVRNVKTTDLVAVLDLNNEITQGQKTLTTRITLPKYPNVWVYYGDTATGYDVLVTVGRK